MAETLNNADIPSLAKVRACSNYLAQWDSWDDLRMRLNGYLTYSGKLDTVGQVLSALGYTDLAKSLRGELLGDMDATSLRDCIRSSLIDYFVQVKRYAPEEVSYHAGRVLESL
jgi:hypothetical protein